MLKAYKYRIYPNKEQKEFFAKSFGCNRFIWNKMLEERIRVYSELKDDKEALKSHKYTTEKEYKNEFEFLKEVELVPLQQTRINLFQAYQNFYRRVKQGQTPGFPKFKSKNNNQSYRTLFAKNNIKIDFVNHKIKIPKLPWIKYSDDRTFQGQIRSVTISKNKSNQYFASILIETNTQPKEKINEITKILALDMSAKNFAVSEDKQFTNPKFYRKIETKLSRLHQSLSRKIKGSNNRSKAQLLLAREYQKLSNRKSDWTHKLSKQLIDEYDAIIIEDLNLESMKQFNSGLSKTVTLDFSWGEFTQQLKYKAQWNGKYLVKVDQFFPSSKLCSACGYKNDNLTLNDREWTCPECGAIHDRDVNASKNIKVEGIRILCSIPNIKINTVGTTEIHACGDMNLVTDPAQESLFFRAV